jgi:hypothetical protein
MSAQTKRTLEVTALLLSLILAVAGVAKTYFVVPVRLEALEEQAKESKLDHTLLIRIDERTSQTQRDVAEIKAQITAISTK